MPTPIMNTTRTNQPSRPGAESVSREVVKRQLIMGKVCLKEGKIRSRSPLSYLSIQKQHDVCGVVLLLTAGHEEVMPDRIGQVGERVASNRAQETVSIFDMNKHEHGLVKLYGLEKV